MGNGKELHSEMVTFAGFQPSDFEVFTIEGLDARMDAIKTRIRPKFEILGNRLSPLLSVMTGNEMYPHIAKHARRTVNPPNDTWIAWADDKRGYKKHPHFQVGLWETHLFVWYAVIYESPYKEAISNALLKQIDQVMNLIPQDFHWSADHTRPDSDPQQELGKDGVLKLIRRLQTVKKAELLCGITIDRNDPIVSDGEKLMERIEETFRTLSQLSKLGRPVVQV